jgi:hypothetical protein
MIKISLVLLLSAFAQHLRAADFCAVRVTISTPYSAPASTPVALIDADSHIVKKFDSINGVAEFCDFGFGEYSIRVGSDQCGQVTLGHIQLVYGLPQHFSVVLNPCLMGADGGRYPPSCLVYFRVASSEGTGLGSAFITVAGDTRQFKADQYGRIFTGLRNGSSKDFTISADGFEDQIVPVSCKSYETIEKAVSLSAKK